MRVHIHWAGRGEPLLFIPGWNTLAASVLSWIPGPFRERFHCGVVEWPGLGTAGGDPLPAAVEDLLDALAAELPPDPLPVAGFCLGGVCAWMLAQRHPARIRQVVLAESTGHFPAVLAPLLLPGLGPLLLRVARNTRLGRLLVERAILQPETVYSQAFRQELFAFDPEAGLHYLRLFRRYAGRLPREARTPVPCGRLDGGRAVRALAPAWGRRRSVEGPRLRLEGAGHFPAVETPSAFFAGLEALLRGPEASGGPGTAP